VVESRDTPAGGLAAGEADDLGDRGGVARHTHAFEQRSCRVVKALVRRIMQTTTTAGEKHFPDRPRACLQSLAIVAEPAYRVFVRHPSTRSEMILSHLRPTYMRILLIVCALASPAFAVAAPESGPLATLKAKNDQVDLLLRKKVTKDSPEEKKVKDDMKQVASSLLDYEELGKKALDAHWAELKPAQQKEFISTFKEMLEKNYVKQLRTNLDYNVTYKDEKVTGEQAVVQSVVKVKTKGKSTDADIVYKMRKTGPTWMVWDIVTDEVSLLRNYKTQFHKIITEQGYDKLLEKMKNKLKEAT
jgi:phospholipid transport system substrate-binding protein